MHFYIYLCIYLKKTKNMISSCYLPQFQSGITAFILALPPGGSEVKAMWETWV